MKSWYLINQGSPEESYRDEKDAPHGFLSEVINLYPKNEPSQAEVSELNPELSNARSCINLS